MRELLSAFHCVVFRPCGYLNEFMTLPNLCMFPAIFIFPQNLQEFDSFRSQVFQGDLLFLAVLGFPFSSQSLQLQAQKGLSVFWEQDPLASFSFIHYSFYSHLHLALIISRPSSLLGYGGVSHLILFTVVRMSFCFCYGCCRQGESANRQALCSTDSLPRLPFSPLRGVLSPEQSQRALGNTRQGSGDNGPSDNTFRWR